MPAANVADLGHKPTGSGVNKTGVVQLAQFVVSGGGVKLSPSFVKNGPKADGRVVSYEVGVVKPEQEIFKIFVDKYNLYILT